LTTSIEYAKQEKLALKVGLLEPQPHGYSVMHGIPLEHLKYDGRIDEVMAFQRISENNPDGVIKLKTLRKSFL
jgi:hypothetical protein